jgi:hypothetical protein
MERQRQRDGERERDRDREREEREEEVDLWIGKPTFGWSGFCQRIATKSFEFNSKARMRVIGPRPRGVQSIDWCVEGSIM